MGPSRVLTQDPCPLGLPEFLIAARMDIAACPLRLAAALLLNLRRLPVVQVQALDQRFFPCSQETGDARCHHK